VNWQRARYRLGQDVEELEVSPAEKHPIAFGILFIGTVLQAIKIFGFQGVVWAKLWAISYLSSYMIVALVGFLALKDWRDNPPEIFPIRRWQRRTEYKFENLSKFLLDKGLVAHFTCCSWIMTQILPRDWPSPGGFCYVVFMVVVPFIVILYITMFICCLGVLVPIALLLGIRSVVNNAIRSFLRRYCGSLDDHTFLIFGCFYMIGWFFYSMGYLFPQIMNAFTGSDGSNPGTVFKIAQSFSLGGAHLGLFIWVLRCCQKLLALLERTTPSLEGLISLLNSHGHLVVFASWNFLEALLYYRLRYDSKGTIKPSWTDNLG
jgi:hypothetical protein